MSSAEQIGRSPNSHLAAAGRRPLPDLYDLVQGRENPAVICRCQKTGIGGKSADHRTILKACDAAFIFKLLPWSTYYRQTGKRERERSYIYYWCTSSNNNMYMGEILWLVLLLQVRSSGLKSVKMYRM